MSFHFIHRARSVRSRSVSRFNDDATKKRGVRASRPRASTRHRFTRACIHHSCIIHSSFNPINHIFRACTSRVDVVPRVLRARARFAIRREEGRGRVAATEIKSRLRRPDARLGDGKKVFNQQYSAISQDFTSTDITPCAKMPRGARRGVVFVPIVCVRARLHGYGCAWGDEGTSVCLM